MESEAPAAAAPVSVPKGKKGLTPEQLAARSENFAIGRAINAQRRAERKQIIDQVPLLADEVSVKLEKEKAKRKKLKEKVKEIEKKVLEMHTERQVKKEVKAKKVKVEKPAGVEPLVVQKPIPIEKPQPAPEPVPNVAVASVIPVTRIAEPRDSQFTAQPSALQSLRGFSKLRRY